MDEDTRTTRRRRRSNPPGPGAAVLLGALIAVAGCATHQAAARPPGHPSPAQPVGGRVVEEAGIRVEGLRLSAAGYILDFRYRVIDQARAAGLLDGRTHPVLVDGRGARLGVPSTPLLGSLRQTARNGKVSPNHTYFILFANPGRYLHAGDRVSLLVGDAKVSDLTVE